jgi:guanylate kinase
LHVQRAALARRAVLGVAPSEVHGRDYFFIDMAKFDNMVRGGKLLESAKVFGNYYGTPRDAVEKALAAGRDVLFDIDWQGTQQLREKAEGDLVSVFLLPPSIDELRRRLKSRAQDSNAVIRDRMSRAGHEMSHWAEYDYVVINHDLDRTFANIRAILHAERLKRMRQRGLTSFVRRLQAKL